MITADEFRKARIKHDLKKVPIRNCSICDCELGLEFHNGNLFFNSNCGCGFPISPLQPRSWESFAEWYNRQSEDKQKIIRKYFNL